METSRQEDENSQELTAESPKRISIWRMLLWGIGDFVASMLIIPAILLVAFLLLNIKPAISYIILTAVLFSILWLVSRIFARREYLGEKTGESSTRLIVRGAALVLSILAYVYMYNILTVADQKARQPSCASNQKVLALGLLMYAQDWDETLPPADHWIKAINPSTELTPYLHCSQDTVKTGISYGMNNFLSGRKLADISNPNEVVLLFETAQHRDSPSGGPEDVVQPARHDNGNWYAFLDGHVKWYKQIPSFVLSPIGTAK